MTPDDVRLRHMMDAAREAISFAAGKKRENLAADRMLLLSIVKDIEIIGEAASRVSEERQKKLPQVAWVDIVGMRNRLIHAYFDIDVDIVWDVVSHDLPELLRQLEKAESG